MICSFRSAPEVANSSQRMGFRSSKDLQKSCSEAGPALSHSEALACG